MRGGGPAPGEHAAVHRCGCLSHPPEQQVRGHRASRRCRGRRGRGSTRVWSSLLSVRFHAAQGKARVMNVCARVCPGSALVVAGKGPAGHPPSHQERQTAHVRESAAQSRFSGAPVWRGHRSQPGRAARVALERRNKSFRVTDPPLLTEVARRALFGPLLPQSSPLLGTVLSTVPPGRC